MRDIRDDLRQRVQLLKDERDALQKQLAEKLAELDAYEVQLSSLLAFEEKRAGQAAIEPKTAPPKEPSVNNEEELAADEDFEAAILAIMNNYQPWLHADIKSAMEQENWSIEDGSLGRALQGQLLSMKQRGLIEFVGDRKWRRLRPSSNGTNENRSREAPV